MLMVQGLPYRSILPKSFSSVRQPSLSIRLLLLEPLTIIISEPSPRPQPYSDPIINTHTEQVTKVGMDLS